MGDVKLIDVELSEDQRRRLIEALDNLTGTIIDIVEETGIPFEGGGRLLMMHLTLETISHIAGAVSDALKLYTLERARELGLEPSP